METGSTMPTSDDSSGDSGDGTGTSEQPAVLQSASPTPVGVDNTVDATSDSSGSRDGDAGMSGGGIAGIVVGILLALVLAIAAIMWVRGTPIPCTKTGNPYGKGKTATRPMPMCINPAYVGGADRAALERQNSVA